MFTPPGLAREQTPRHPAPARTARRGPRPRRPRRRGARPRPPTSSGSARRARGPLAARRSADRCATTAHRPRGGPPPRRRPLLRSGPPRRRRRRRDLRPRDSAFLLRARRRRLPPRRASSGAAPARARPLRRAARPPGAASGEVPPRSWSSLGPRRGAGGRGRCGRRRRPPEPLRAPGLTATLRPIRTTTCPAQAVRARDGHRLAVPAAIGAQESDQGRSPGRRTSPQRGASPDAARRGWALRRLRRRVGRRRRRRRRRRPARAGRRHRHGRRGLRLGKGARPAAATSTATGGPPAGTTTPARTPGPTTPTRSWPGRPLRLPSVGSPLGASPLSPAPTRLGSARSPVRAPGRPSLHAELQKPRTLFRRASREPSTAAHAYSAAARGTRQRAAAAGDDDRVHVPLSAHSRSALVAMSVASWASTCSSGGRGRSSRRGS